MQKNRKAAKHQRINKKKIYITSIELSKMPVKELRIERILVDVGYDF